MKDGDLFSVTRDEMKRAQAPLPARMRPRTLDEVIGQRHLLEKGAAFRSMIETGNVSSMILWGPPGTGKTTLARLIFRFLRAYDVLKKDGIKAALEWRRNLVFGKND